MLTLCFHFNGNIFCRLWIPTTKISGISQDWHLQLPQEGFCMYELENILLNSYIWTGVSSILVPTWFLFLSMEILEYWCLGELFMIPPINSFKKKILHLLFVICKSHESLLLCLECHVSSCNITKYRDRESDTLLWNLRSMCLIQRRFIPSLLPLPIFMCNISMDSKLSAGSVL